MELHELLKHTKRVCHIDKEGELKTMLKFYHDLGVIVMHGSTVVLQALWLIDLFKQLINVRPYDKRVNIDTPHNSNISVLGFSHSKVHFAIKLVEQLLIDCQKNMCCNFCICCIRSIIVATQQKVISLFVRKRYGCLSIRRKTKQSVPITVLCKSNANNNRRISRFVLAIYRQYISETSHGLPNVETINHRDIDTIFAISRRDIVLMRLRCNDISQSKMIYHHDIYRCSEVHCNDMS